MKDFHYPDVNQPLDGDDEEEFIGAIKLCDKHLESLRSQIRTTDLAPLAAEDEEVTRQRLEDVQENGLNADNFEPMMYAQMAIFEGALELGGKLLGFIESHGIDLCPICFFNDIHTRYSTEECANEEGFDAWIEVAVAQTEVMYKMLRDGEMPSE